MSALEWADLVLTFGAFVWAVGYVGKLRAER